MEFLHEYGQSVLGIYVAGISMMLFLFERSLADSILWPLTILRDWWRG
mgnify:CR=1 FL=1